MLSIKQVSCRNNYYWLAIFLAIFTTVIWMPSYPELKGIASYLPLHMAMETASIVIACLIFAIGWGKPIQEDDRNTIILSVGFLGVAILDFSHMLSYEGMPSYITGSGPEKAIAFWLAARLLTTFLLLAIATLPWNKVITSFQSWLTLIVVLAFVVLCHGLILFNEDMLPRTFIQESGLTTFKINFELSLVFTYTLAACFFWFSSAGNSRKISALFVATCILALGEFLFTLYADVTDIYNLTGHIFKLGAYLMLYRALFLGAVQEPYDRISDSESWLKATIQAMPDLLFLMDKHGNYLRVYSSESNLLFKSPAELIGKNIKEVIPKNEADIWSSAISEAMHSGVSHGKEILLNVPAGQKWFELSISKQVLTTGEINFIVISRDITARKDHEDQLNQYAKELEGSMSSTLKVLSKMIELRDPYTAGHQKRVGTIARDIAKEMGWEDRDCKNLELVGLVHDIGKIAIPLEILTKSSKLSDLEMQLVQTHAIIGADLLKDVIYLRDVSKVVGQHHERIDGSGYPNHLQGSEIGPAARVIAVADVIEAMSSHRPYRDAVGIDKALEEIENGRGTKYDSEVVDACLTLFRKKGYQIN